MKKWICLPVFMMLAPFAALIAQQQKKPNILFIAVDDLKPILGCYGDKLIKTPNIDRLAKMATVFQSNYVQQAVCGPTRASLMTGKRPDYTKVWDLHTQMREMNPDIVTLPQYLITQGYQTVGIGKIYHPSDALDRIDPVSWSIPYMFAKPEDYANGLGKPANEQYQLASTKEYFASHEKVKKGEEPKKKKGQDDNDEGSGSRKGPSTECIDVPDDAYDDGVNALLAKDEMDKLLKEGKPFFLAVGLHKPHLPFVAPKKYWDMYKREDMPLAEFQEHSKDGPLVAYTSAGELRNYTDIPPFVTMEAELNRIGLKPEKQKELIQGYYAAVTYTDHNVGVLLDELEKQGQLNNTIIVLWGDHGWHLGDHDLWCKHTNFENATRAPLIIAAPGFKGGSTKSLTEHVDVFPTICDLAGVPVPTYLDGKSLVPIMKDKKTKILEYSISQYPRGIKKEEMEKLGYTSKKLMGYSLRTDKYRLTLWINDFTTKSPYDPAKLYAKEMYDYVKDPLEKVNVADHKEYSAIYQDLYKKMLEFFASQVSK